MNQAIAAEPESASRRSAEPVSTRRAAHVTPASDKPSHISLRTRSGDDWSAHQRDLWERSILFWDTLRRRANNMLEHERQGLPPLLVFKSETLLDARTFDRPCNYALLRVTEAEGLDASACVDIRKAPVMVVDPRAGHGPGIGGFKRDSEVGMALREGHPVYFVIFFPEPSRGQTLADVLHGLRRFVEAVAARHPDQPPVLYGNCQAGWALTLLAADCVGLVGPVVLNGSPLSYWSGESGVNPMRLTAGLLGGAWAAEFTADLNDDRFDGAWLAMNFEALKPGNAIWGKYWNLFANIDTERERFLDFERWWNGFYHLSGEEMSAIVENLFIGDQIERGVFRICEGCAADLRRIRNPLVIFASYGDNITPPHQALGWIPKAYKDTDDLKAAGQRIVYLINPHVGHLGVFVSASVARLEHRAILESLAEIEALPPGLYEMKIDNPSDDPDCCKPFYAVRFEPREVADIHFEGSDPAFERVSHVSERNLVVYRSVLAPWVKAAANPWLSLMLKWLHPMRTSRYLLSEQFSPWMRWVAAQAALVEKDRHPASRGSPFAELDDRISRQVSEAFEQARVLRDRSYEQAFALLYDR